jgi:hypothetical protein
MLKRPPQAGETGQTALSVAVSVAFLGSSHQGRNWWDRPTSGSVGGRVRPSAAVGGLLCMDSVNPSHQQRQQTADQAHSVSVKARAAAITEVQQQQLSAAGPLTPTTTHPLQQQSGAWSP